MHRAVLSSRKQCKPLAAHDKFTKYEDKLPNLFELIVTQLMPLRGIRVWCRRSSREVKGDVSGGQRRNRF